MKIDVVDSFKTNPFVIISPYCSTFSGAGYRPYHTMTLVRSARRVLSSLESVIPAESCQIVELVLLQLSQVRTEVLDVLDTALVTTRP